MRFSLQWAAGGEYITHGGELCWRLQCLWFIYRPEKLLRVAFVRERERSWIALAWRCGAWMPISGGRIYYIEKEIKKYELKTVMIGMNS